MCSEMQLKELNDRILYAGQEATVKEPDMEHRLVPNWKKSTLRPYIFTLLI